ncbi:MAG: DUF2220 family protein [Burkholderiaceae bacterium]
MKSPADIARLLTRRFDLAQRQWLAGTQGRSDSMPEGFPIEIGLSVPTEARAVRELEAVRAWLAAWQQWQSANADAGAGPAAHGRLVWGERRWRVLGLQALPERIIIEHPAQCAQWAGQLERWQRACQRYGDVMRVWPQLADAAARAFAVLADYETADFERLLTLVAWLDRHPASALYVRQLPVPGLDTKWLDSRRRLVGEWLGALRGVDPGTVEFHELCGLRPISRLIRVRLLDPALRHQVSGLGDLTLPLESFAALALRPARVIVVENLQTGLAFEDLPGGMVIMSLGYGVDALAAIPWLAGIPVCYWGDLDTHGLAILNRARHYLPHIESVLMDEATLLEHQPYWGHEAAPSEQGGDDRLTEAEARLLADLRRGRWGIGVRLEQERIDWRLAWSVMSARFTGPPSPANQD